MRSLLRALAFLCMLGPAIASAQDPTAERTRRTQGALVSSLDPALPDIALDVWLRQVLGPSARLQWTSGSCAGPRGRDISAVPLCGIVDVTDSGSVVTIGVRLGEYLQDTKADRYGTPRADEAYVARGSDRVMLDRLGDLPRILKLQSREWPRPDIVLDSITCLPERAEPHETVTCSMALANNGAAPSSARVFIDIEGDGRRSGGEEVKLQAGQRRSLRLKFPWPEEDGASIAVGIELKEPTPYHRVNGRGGLALTNGEDLTIPWDLLDWEDDENALRTIISARPRVGARPSLVDVPVDASITRLVVGVEYLPGIAAVLLRPGGTRVVETDRDVRLSTVKTVDLKRNVRVDRQVYTIGRPQPGVWQIMLPGDLRGTGQELMLTASGNSPVGFDDFEFVRLQQGVHGGYFQIDGMPLAGVPATAQARVRRGPVEPTFRFVDERNIDLGVLPLAKGLPHTAGDDFLGTFGLPAVPFRVVMNGIDAAGTPVQRQYPLMFRAQPVAVFFNYDRSGLINVGTSRRTFAVMNVGTETATFVLNVSTTDGEVLGLSPSTVTLAPRTSATASFSLSIPANEQHFGRVSLRITATNIADPSINNAVLAGLEIGPAGDTNNDSAVSVRRLTPESGEAGTAITIAGSGFKTSGLYMVMFDGLPVPAVVKSATEMTFMVPASAPVGPVVPMIFSENTIVMSPVPFLVLKPSGKR